MSKNQVIYEISGQFLTYLQNWFLLSNLEFECFHPRVRCTRIFLKFLFQDKNDRDCNIANFTSTIIFLLWLVKITHICLHHVFRQVYAIEEMFFLKFLFKDKNDRDCNIANFTSTIIFLLWLVKITHICLHHVFRQVYAIEDMFKQC